MQEHVSQESPDLFSGIRAEYEWTLNSRMTYCPPFCFVVGSCIVDEETNLKSMNKYS